MESLKEPTPKYGVLVTCFSSYGGFSSSPDSSPLCSASFGVWSFLLEGKSTEDGDALVGEPRGVVKILDDGVTKVREWLLGSGERTSDESKAAEVWGAPEVSWTSDEWWVLENTSDWGMSTSKETLEDFSSSANAPESVLSRRSLASPLPGRKRATIFVLLYTWTSLFVALVSLTCLYLVANMQSYIYPR